MCNSSRFVALRKLSKQLHDAISGHELRTEEEAVQSFKDSIAANPLAAILGTKDSASGEAAVRARYKALEAENAAAAALRELVEAALREDEDTGIFRPQVDRLIRTFNAAEAAGEAAREAQKAALF